MFAVPSYNLFDFSAFFCWWCIDTTTNTTWFFVIGRVWPFQRDELCVHCLVYRIEAVVETHPQTLKLCIESLFHRGCSVADLDGFCIQAVIERPEFAKDPSAQILNTCIHPVLHRRRGVADPSCVRI